MTRARKSGDAAHLERKLEEKYDEIEAIGTPKAVVDWIYQVLEGKIEKTTGYTWEEIQTHLKDGVTLCKFINKLLQADGKKTVSFNPRVKSAFIAMTNIEAFNDGAKEYGVPVTELFQSVDLYEGRKAQMLNVINCINKLGFVANKKQFQPQYTPPAPPKADWARDDD